MGITSTSAGPSTGAYNISTAIGSLASPLAISMETYMAALPLLHLSEPRPKCPCPPVVPPLHPKLALHLEEPPQYFVGMKVLPQQIDHHPLSPYQDCTSLHGLVASPCLHLRTCPCLDGLVIDLHFHSRTCTSSFNEGCHSQNASDRTCGSGCPHLLLLHLGPSLHIDYFVTGIYFSFP